MTESTESHAGGCLCGAVRYVVHGPLRPIVACHCDQCRRTTGHYLASTAALRSNVRLLAQQGLKWYDSSGKARRGFCADCGSTLFWNGTGLDYLSIAAGSLDDSTGLHIACHIFVADKGAYYEIDPAVPQSPDGTFSVSVPAG